MKNYPHPDPTFALLNVRKPGGITSRDVVNRVQQLLPSVKVGHAGTLDPMATGVLVLCLGQATRLVELVQHYGKVYRAQFLLGKESDTEDTSGAVVEVPNSRPPTIDQLIKVLPDFVGHIQQRPPAYSALKVGGKRAYSLARCGQVVDLAPRTIFVATIEVESYEYPQLTMRIECGSGTYVRSLGRDVAQRLGTACVMSELERLAVGPFEVESAVSLDDLNAETIRQNLLPPALGVQHLPMVHLTQDDVANVLHGRSVRRVTPAVKIGMIPAGDPNTPLTEVAAFKENTNELVALVERLQDEWKPVKVFRR